MIKKGACLLAFLLLAQGVFAANNNFVNPPASAIIKSPADARGPHNVDCCLSEADTVETIESKVCVIDSKIDAIDFNITVTLSSAIDVMVDLSGVYTSLAEIDSKIDIIDVTADETLSKVCVIDSKLDDLNVNVDLSEVVSKICEVDSSVDVVDEIAGDILSKTCVIDSKLDTLEVSGACDATPIEGTGTPVPATPISGPVTLDTSGHYCLTADLDVSSGDAIVITGTNVTLDLNGYTISGGGYGSNGIVISGDNAEIFNGTVSGFADAGISITGNKNNIHDVTVKDSTIGFELVGADNNVIEHSTAQCNTQAGFSLTNSNHNQFIDDKALSTSGSGDVYGFISTGGLGNRFINSLASDTDTSSALGNTVAGFALLNGEQCSEICGSTANKTSAATGTSDAYGVLVQQAGGKQYTFDTTSLTGVKSYAFNSPSTAEFVNGDGTTYLDAKWYQNGYDKYLAVAGEADSGGVNVRILQYDSGTETLTALPYATFNNGATVRSVDWIELYGRQFLAIGGDETYDYYSSNVRILEFDPTYGTLVEVANFDTDDYPEGLYQVNSLEWLPGTNYLAVTGNFNVPGNFAQILEFDATSDTLSLTTTGTVGAPVSFLLNELNWQTIGGTDYLSLVGKGANGINYVLVAQFVGGAVMFTAVGGGFANTPLTGKWLSTGGTHYIAVGTDVGGYGSEVLLFTFDGIMTLTPLPSGTFTHDANINDVEWLQASGCTFLGVSSDVSAGGNEFFMLEFNTASETFSEVSGVSINTDEAIHRFDWLDDGTIFAGFSYTPPTAADQSASVSNLTISAGAPPADVGNIRLDAKWLVCDGVKYLAVAGDTDPSGASVKILQYDPTTDTLSETPYATFDHGATVRSIDWITSGGRNFLAIGGDDSYDTYSYNVRILEFDCAYGTLTEIANYDTASSTPDGPTPINSLKWLPGTKYLAVAGDAGPSDSFVQILEFDAVGETLTLFTSALLGFPLPAFGNEIDWLTCEGVHYLSWAGSVDTGMGIAPLVLFLIFDPYYPSLTLGGLAPPALIAPDTPPRTAKWLVCGDTKYIAVGTETNPDGSEILLYTFDPYAAAFTAVPSATFSHDANINDIEWLEKAGCKFLGVTSDVSAGGGDPIGGGGDPIGGGGGKRIRGLSGNQFCLLEFDPDAETFSPVSGVSLNLGETMNRFDWLDCGDVCLAGYSLSPSSSIGACSVAGTAVSELTITQILDSLSNIIKNNVVIGTTGGSGGTGYSLNVDNNLLIGNVSCDNGTNYDLTGVIIQPDAIVKSQMDARGVQNVDCNLTDPDTVEVIESKVCVIDSKIDTLQISAPCDPTPLTAVEIPVPPTPIPVTTTPITIDTSGHYCLSADLEIDKPLSSFTNATAITISASDVTLDLNGYTIRQVVPVMMAFGGTTGIQVTGDNVEIFNGTINGHTESPMFSSGGRGISIEGTRAFIHDVTFTDNTRGIYIAPGANGAFVRDVLLSGNTTGIESRSNNNLLQSCRAVGGTTGFDFVSTIANSVVNCEASGASKGFDLSMVTNSVFVRCIANNNTTSGFTTGYVSSTEFKDCQAMYNGSSGFNLAGADTTVTLLRNVACGNGAFGENNYVNPPSNAVITSAANADGWDNIDCSDDTGDIVESKLCLIESIVDNIMVDFTDTLTSIAAVESKVCVIDSKIDDLQVTGACDATPIEGAGTPIPATPITGPVTLDTSGHYCLAADLDVASGDAIVITGTNVTLDLNGYTISGTSEYATNGIVISGDNVEVFNGTVSGFANAGISITGNKNNIHDVTSKDNAIGFKLVNANNNTIKHSRALCNTNAGFSLNNSDNNQFIDDQALEMNGIDTDVFGFISTNGMGNRFISCLAENINAIDYADTTARAAGFEFEGEECSEICDSTVIKVTAPDDAVGINFAADQATMECLATFTHGKDLEELLFDAKWLEFDGVKYLAVGGNLNFYQYTIPDDPYDFADVRVLKYDEATDTLTQVAFFAHRDSSSGTSLNNAGVKAVDWQVINGIPYLAIGGEASVSDEDYDVNVRILEFDPVGGTLTDRGSYDLVNNVAEHVDDVEWLPGTNFLAVLTNSVVPNDRLIILEFDEYYSSLTLVDSYDNSSPTTEPFSRLGVTLFNGNYFIAISESDATYGTDAKLLEILQFDTSTKTLTLRATQVVEEPTAVDLFLQDFVWFEEENTLYLVALQKLQSFGSIPADTRILTFTFDDTTFALDQIENGTYTIFQNGATASDQPGGLSTISFNGQRFVAVGFQAASVDATTDNIFLLNFDFGNQTCEQSTQRYSLTTAKNYLSDGTVNFGLVTTDMILSTLNPNRILIGTAKAADNLIVTLRGSIAGVFGADIDFLQDNVIKNNVVKGVKTTGGYAQGIGISMNIDNNLMIGNVACNNDANYCVSGAVIQPSSVIKSQADARGVQNIDCDLTDVDNSIEVIESKVCDIDANIAVLDSKIDAFEVSGVCDPTPITASETPVPATSITGPVTLSASGHYCLAADLDVASGDAIVITGTNVTLDLNGYTISNSGSANNGIVISGDNAEVFNGTISGFVNAGISISGDKNNIHDVTSKDNAIGFELVNADNNTIEHSRALCNTNAGFSLTNSNNNQFIDDQALEMNSADTDVFGFISTGGMGNRFIGCVAQDINTDYANTTARAAGFEFDSEQCSEICNSTVIKVTASDDAIGINLGSSQADLELLATFTHGVSTVIEREFLVDAKWLEFYGEKYLAVAGQINIFRYDLDYDSYDEVDVRVLHYDEGTNTLTQVATFVHRAEQTTGLNSGAAVQGIDWQVTNGIPYLAIAGKSSDSDENYDVNVRILEFDPVGGTLTDLASYDFSPTSLITEEGRDVRWLQGTNFLAVLTNSAGVDRLLILEFDEYYGSLTLVASYDNSTTDEDYPAHLGVVPFNGNYFIAISETNGSSNLLEILEFDTTAETLTLRATEVRNGHFPNFVWFEEQNRLYLAGIEVETYGSFEDIINAQLHTFIFDGTTYSLEQLANSSFTIFPGGGMITTADDAGFGLSTISFEGQRLLAVGFQPNSINDPTTNNLYLLDFDFDNKTCEQIAQRYSVLGAKNYLSAGRYRQGIVSTDMILSSLNSDRILIGTAKAGTYVPNPFSDVRISIPGVFGADVTFLKDNIIKNNVVKGVKTTGGYAQGIGIQMNIDDNLMISNVSCNNDANYNASSVILNSSSIIKSQADARGVQNVDCDLTDADSVEVIESKVCVIDSKIDNLNVDVDLSFVESKVCVIDSKVDNITVDVMVDQSDTLTSIAAVESKLCVVEDTINQDFGGTFTTLDTIESKIDAIEINVTVTLSSSIDVMVDMTDTLTSIAAVETKVCTVDSKVDQLIEFSCSPTLITQADIPLTISTSGHYILAEDVTHTSSDTAILIDSDDVILDLCNHTVFGDNTLTYGIEVETEHTNIVIKNGVVSGISSSDRIASGIVIKGGCSRIEIDNVDVLNLATLGGFGGIIIANSSGGFFDPDFSGYPLNDISHVTIKNCHISNGSYGIRVKSNPGDVISDIVIDSVDVDTMTVAAINYSGAMLGNDFTQITNSVIRNCTIAQCSGGNVVSIDTASNILIDSCMVNNNVGTGGIYFGGSTLKCTVSHCTISCNESTGGPGGFFTGVDASGDSITVRDTTIEENSDSSKGLTGIRFNGSENGIVEGCVVARNTSSGGPTRGVYFFSSSNNGHIVDCICDSNTSTSGIAVGIDIESSEKVMVSGCSATSQSATVSDAYGFRVPKTSSCIMFVDCVAKDTQGYTEGTGFYLNDITDSNVIRCISNKNQTTGFRTSVTSLPAVSNLEFKDCQAFYNGEHGFDLSGSDSTVRLFRNIASDNGTYP